MLIFGASHKQTKYKLNKYYKIYKIYLFYFGFKNGAFTARTQTLIEHEYQPLGRVLAFVVDQQTLVDQTNLHD